MTFFDRPFVTATTCAEASSASPLERRCVVHTIFNRLAFNPTRFGASLAGVCVKRMQFSEFNADKVDNANLERVLTLSAGDPTVLDCAAAFDEVDGGAPDPTHGATHYYDHSIDPPDWAAAPAVVTLTTNKFTFLKNVA